MSFVLNESGQGDGRDGERGDGHRGTPPQRLPFDDPVREGGQEQDYQRLAGLVEAAGSRRPRVGGIDQPGQDDRGHAPGGSWPRTATAGVRGETASGGREGEDRHPGLDHGSRPAHTTASKQPGTANTTARMLHQCGIATPHMRECRGNSRRGRRLHERALELCRKVRAKLTRAETRMIRQPTPLSARANSCKQINWRLARRPENRSDYLRRSGGRSVRPTPL